MITRLKFSCWWVLLRLNLFFIFPYPSVADHNTYLGPIRPLFFSLAPKRRSHVPGAGSDDGGGKGGGTTYALQTHTFDFYIATDVKAVVLIKIVPNNNLTSAAK